MQTLIFVALVFLAPGFVQAETPKALKLHQEGPVFPRGKIKLGKKTIGIEIADNNELREHGLMFRESLPENEGMLFIFENERQLTFWMKNTLIPLSIGYFNREKKLVDIKEMVPAVVGAVAPVLYPSKEQAMYALEMQKGWFARNKIKEGTTFAFVSAGSREPTKP